MCACEHPSSSLVSWMQRDVFHLLWTSARTVPIFLLFFVSPSCWFPLLLFLLASFHHPRNLDRPLERKSCWRLSGSSILHCGVILRCCFWKIKFCDEASAWWLKWQCEWRWSYILGFFLAFFILQNFFLSPLWEISSNGTLRLICLLVEARN